MNIEEYRTYEGAFVKMINGGFFDINGYKLICQSANITSVKPSSDQKYKVDMSVAYRFAAIPGQNPKTNLSSQYDESNFYQFLMVFMQSYMGNTLSIHFVSQRLYFPWGSFPSY